MGFHVKPLECRRLTSEYKGPMMEFLHALEESGDAKLFHPHPFDEEAIDKVAQCEGKDLYYILVEGNSVIGYAMLRGWDEGYEIPSLGIAIHPTARKVGLGQLLMSFLHVAARRQGATKVRLRVYAHNTKAIQLYKKLGYEFQPATEDGYLVGYYALSDTFFISAPFPTGNARTSKQEKVE